MMPKRHAAAAGALVLVMTAGVALSADGGQTPTAPAPSAAPAAAEVERQRVAKELNASNVDVDFTVPASPAFVALGLSPETIVRPSTPREFATSLLNGVDQNGNLQTGVALEASPFLVFAGRRLTLSEYRASRLTQMLTRTTLSFATTRGASSEDKSVKLALGVNATLYDSEDPRLYDDLLDCYALIPLFRTTVLPLDEAAKRQIELRRQEHEKSVLVPAVEKCRAQFKLPRRWNSTSWTVAFAPTWASPTGLAKDIESGSFTVWSSLSYGFDGVPVLRDRAQLIGHVRLLADETVVDEKLPGGSEIRDTTVAGAKLRAGTRAFGFSLEAAYLQTTAPGRAKDKVARLAVAAERRLAENLWMTVSFGGDRGVDHGGPRGMSLLSALKWGLAKDPTLTPDQIKRLGGQ